MKFELTILGSNSAIPAHGRYPTAQVLNVHGQLYLIDCGEGTQMRMNDFGIRRSRIHQIFISHLHGDHFFGLVGLLTTYCLLGRKEALEVFSPPGLEEIIDLQLAVSGTVLPYPLHFRVLNPAVHTKIFEDTYVKVYSIPLRHRIPTCGFLFREKPPLRHIRPELIERLGIPYQEIKTIKEGADFTSPDGSVIPNSELTLPGDRPRSYAYCSDTAFAETIIPMVKGVDLLYHEATFKDEKTDYARQTLHSTARQAGEIARRAGVGRLVLGHYSTRYKDLSELLAEAQSVFPATELGLDGVRVEVQVNAV